MNYDNTIEPNGFLTSFRTFIGQLIAACRFAILTPLSGAHSIDAHVHMAI